MARERQARTRRLLVVSYLFPPLAGAGVHRWAKMVKFLPEYGWEPTVVTAAGDRRVHVDAGLAREVAPDVRVRRVRDYGCKYAAAAARSLLRAPLMEGHEGWVPFATRAVLRELSARHYDAVCTTLGPFTLMQIGLAVRQQVSIPWVMDLRDPSWSHACGVGSPARSRAERRRRRALEVEAYRTADRVVVVDEGVRAAIHADTALDAGHVDLVPNGYDDDDFPGPLAAHAGGAVRNHFQLAFLGKLRSNYRIEGLLRAVDRLLQDPAHRRTFRLTFAGEIERPVADMLRQRLPRGCVQIDGYLSVRQACARMVNADMLLFLLPDYPDGAAQRVHSKTYNYLRAGRPILAPVHPGAAADLLARSGAARILPPGDDGALHASLRDAVEAWQRGALSCHTDWTLVRRFGRRTLAGEFARVLDGLVGDVGDVRRSAA